jgi:hypothetical protein
MKINGIKLSNTPYEELVIIPRSEGDIVLRVRAILDYEPFDKMCPEPKPPTIQRAGEAVGRPNYEDLKFKEARGKHRWKRTCWMFLKSLQATEGLEFDVVRLEDPGTWEDWPKEIKEAGFSEAEGDLIWGAVMTVNGMNEAKLEAARKRFLTGPQAAPAPS